MFFLSLQKPMPWLVGLLLKRAIQIGSGHRTRAKLSLNLAQVVLIALGRQMPIRSKIYPNSPRFYHILAFHVGNQLTLFGRDIFAFLVAVNRAHGFTNGCASRFFDGVAFYGGLDAANGFGFRFAFVFFNQFAPKRQMNGLLFQ